MRRLTVGIGLVCAAACGSNTLVIESDTQWSGSAGGLGSSETIQGSGNRTFDMGNEESFCWSLQKQTRSGSLRVYAKVPTITGVDRQGDGVTSADFGVVSGCMK